MPRRPPYKPGARKLNRRQEQFIHEYMIDGVAKDAAKRAGYTGSNTGINLMRVPAIVEEIDRLRTTRIKEIDITAERVLREIARLAFSDPRKLYDRDGNMLPIHLMDDDSAATIGGLDFDNIVMDDPAGEDGGKIVKAVLKKIKVWDKNSALEKLGKHFKLWDDNVKLTATLKMITNVEPE